MGLLRLMGNKADVVKGLAKRCNENWSMAPKSDIGLYLSDIQDHLITMTQSLNHYEKLLSRSHSNYLAQISIEMTDANNQINDVLSRLTALGTILIPMNLITGLWGMNVHVPGQNVSGYGWFIGIICFLVVIGGKETIERTLFPLGLILRTLLNPEAVF
ncbi:CorA metal ion transporter [Serendipita sp. 398]|nr:CorA metal ion transporter [Serendipita sp. 398]